MTEFEMTSTLSEKMNVTLEEAKAALEAADWNMLDAAVLIEQGLAEQAKRRADEAAQAGQAFDENVKACRTGCRGFFRTLGAGIRRAFNIGNRNHLQVRRGDGIMLEIPVTVLALALVCAFWVCVPLMVIGLFCGCHYSFTGADLDRENINSAMERVSQAADKVKTAVMEG